MYKYERINVLTMPHANIFSKASTEGGFCKGTQEISLIPTRINIKGQKQNMEILISDFLFNFNIYFSAATFASPIVP